MGSPFRLTRRRHASTTATASSFAGPDGDVETVRILGIDTPETRHDEHGIPIDQPFGPEARAFAQGAFAVATDIKMIRAGMLDPYGRTLAYLILNGKNYSVLVIRARLSDETVTLLRR